MKKLYRSRQNRMIAGVCGGIANYFNVDPTLIRIAAAVLFVLTAGIGWIIAYIVAVILVPNAEDLE
ncbi:PspC domain-containing protein [Shouchella shacheensis]|uniref:PspC domain-containing protein n=1 Tax=Shouchella shacheensis TaxID=1649580 RepID=UPI00074000B2|nr:PspC domain-containing protein [Shouchella shacheensis]